MKGCGVKGRGLFATKAIRRGDVILAEESLVSGPLPNSTPVCPGCLTRLKPDKCVPCPKCTLPVCKTTHCAQSIKHRPECELLSRNKVTIKVCFTPSSPALICKIPCADTSSTTWPYALFRSKIMTTRIQSTPQSVRSDSCLSETIFSRMTVVTHGSGSLKSCPTTLRLG